MYIYKKQYLQILKDKYKTYVIEPYFPKDLLSTELYIKNNIETQKTIVTIYHNKYETHSKTCFFYIVETPLLRKLIYNEMNNNNKIWGNLIKSKIINNTLTNNEIIERIDNDNNYIYIYPNPKMYILYGKNIIKNYQEKYKKHKINKNFIKINILKLLKYKDNGKNIPIELFEYIKNTFIDFKDIEYLTLNDISKLKNNIKIVINNYINSKKFDINYLYKNTLIHETINKSKIQIYIDYIYNYFETIINYIIKPQLYLEYECIILNNNYTPKYYYLTDLKKKDYKLLMQTQIHISQILKDKFNIEKENLDFNVKHSLINKFKINVSNIINIQNSNIYAHESIKIHKLETIIYNLSLDYGSNTIYGPSYEYYNNITFYYLLKSEFIIPYIDIYNNYLKNINYNINFKLIYDFKSITSNNFKTYINIKEHILMKKSFDNNKNCIGSRKIYEKTQINKNIKDEIKKHIQNYEIVLELNTLNNFIILRQLIKTNNIIYGIGYYKTNIEKLYNYIIIQYYSDIELNKNYDTIYKNNEFTILEYKTENNYEIYIKELNSDDLKTDDIKTINNIFYKYEITYEKYYDILGKYLDYNNLNYYNSSNKLKYISNMFLNMFLIDKKEEEHEIKNKLFIKNDIKIIKTLKTTNNKIFYKTIFYLLYPDFINEIRKTINNINEKSIKQNILLIIKQICINFKNNNIMNMCLIEIEKPIFIIEYIKNINRFLIEILKYKKYKKHNNIIFKLNELQHKNIKIKTIFNKKEYYIIDLFDVINKLLIIVYYKNINKINEDFTILKPIHNYINNYRELDLKTIMLNYLIIKSININDNYIIDYYNNGLVPSYNQTYHEHFKSFNVYNINDYMVDKKYYKNLNKSISSIYNYYNIIYNKEYYKKLNNVFIMSDKIFQY